jgi:parallel beta-helix repeat protein
MNKKHFYSAVILLLFLAVGIQPAFAAVHTLVPGTDTYFGAWNGNTFTFNSDLVGGDSIIIIDQLAPEVLIIDGDGHTINSPDADAGVYINNSTFVNIMNLNVTNCAEGIHLNHVNHIDLINNDVSECQYGIYMFEAGTCIYDAMEDRRGITGNNIVSNGCGIWLQACVTIDIYNNNFIDNGMQANVPSSGNINICFNLLAEDGGGNYWSDWSLTSDPPQSDIDGDGFVDDPYIINTEPDPDIQDEYPLAAPLPLTPEAMIQILILDVEKLNSKEGIINSLDAKLQNALDALDAANAGQRQDAINKMEAFINAVLAQSGNQISEVDAALLIAQAEDIIAQL